MLEDKINLEELQKKLLDSMVANILTANTVIEYREYMTLFKDHFEYTRKYYPKLFREYKVPGDNYEQR